MIPHLRNRKRVLQRSGQVLAHQEGRRACGREAEAAGVGARFGSRGDFDRIR